MSEPMTRAAAVTRVRSMARGAAIGLAGGHHQDHLALLMAAEAIEQVAALEAEGGTLPADTVQDVNAATLLTIAADEMAGTMPGEIIAMIRRGVDALRQRRHLLAELELHRKVEAAARDVDDPDLDETDVAERLARAFDALDTWRATRG